MRACDADFPNSARGLARFAPEIAIVALALAVRVVLFIGVGAWDPERLQERIFVGDARAYHRLAVNLVEHGVYSSGLEPRLEPNTFRVPGYPSFLAVVYALWGPHPHLAILLQLVLGALTCAVVCRVGSLLFDRRAGIVAGSILAIDYSAVVFSNRLYADTLLTLFVALSLYALARFVVSGGKPSLAAAGFLLALATLCRPVSLFIGLAMAPVVWLRSRRRPGLALARWALLVAAFVLTLTPWALRNQRITGRPYVTSMQASIPGWYLPWLMKDTRNAPRGASSRDAAVEAAPSRDRELRSGRSRPLLASVRHDAVRYARGTVRYFAILGSGEIPLLLGIPYGRHDAIALRDAGFGEWVAATLRNRSTPLQRSIVVGIAAYLVALYLAAARGLWRAARARRWVEIALLLATIVYFVVATGPIAREVRYRLPALPAIVLFAGLGLARRAEGARADTEPPPELRLSAR
ncbi:MAG TPA: glycosyltransferase family 39 protein [Thermoanaerobaculia bacterium]|nr:glycosyltransferase family 39 protein [Thermoanaerobaculia bacterium]